MEIKAMYFEWDKIIETSEKYFLDILQGVLGCDHQGHNPEQSQGL